MKKSIFAVCFLALVACESDDVPQIINEEELITTVEVTLTNSMNPADIVILRSVDADGDGPLPAVAMASGSLTAGASYMGSTRFLNELEMPAEDITEEVSDESDEHEVFYVSGVLTVTKTDVDINGNPLGLTFNAQTGAAGTGTLTVVLRHELTKPNDNTLAGAGGSTDAEVTFNITIQ